MASCWLWTGSVYVGISAFLNLNTLSLGVECTMVRLQLYTHVLFKYTTMATTHTHTRLYLRWFRFWFWFWFWWNKWNGVVLALFGRAVCTLVHISACFILNVLLLDIYNRLEYTIWHDRNCTPIMCCSNSLQWRLHTAPDGFWFWWNKWNGIVFALDEQAVRWY